jgi:hypothetical protein
MRWPRDTLCPQKLALTSLTSGGRLVDIVRLQTKATEYFSYLPDRPFQVKFKDEIASLRKTEAGVVP